MTAAIGQTQELAGDRTVAVNNGEVGGQILQAGLVDEVAMDVVPVVIGAGGVVRSASAQGFWQVLLSGSA